MIKSIKKGLLFGITVTFVFGQIPSLIFHLILQGQAPFAVLDVLIGCYVVITLYSNRYLTRVVLNSFIAKVILVVTFGFIVANASISIFQLENAFYLIRIVTYLIFGYVLWFERILTRKEILSFILAIGISVATIGFVQYFLFADMRQLKVLGWDDHYFRLTAPFLDPAFTGIILVLSALSIFFYWKPQHKAAKVLVLGYVLLALLLTYSRASYLSLIAALSLYGLMNKKIQLWMFLFAALFIGSVFVIPRPDGSEGVKLERTFSIILKAENTRDIANIFMKYPLFGVGYNNLCSAISLDQPIQTARYSHSCSGADNSIALILATTGVIGGMMVLWGARYLVIGQKPEIVSILSAVFIHTQFTNTLFYPWVLVWIAFVGSIFFKKRR